MYLDQVAKVLQGTLRGKNLLWTELQSDTRKIMPGQVYIALKGEQFDGHDFLQEAEQKGAGALIAEAKSVQKKSYSIPVVMVEDTTQALGKLAHYWRAQFSIPIVGVTGSCGKTTVKSMIGNILSLAGNTLVSEGSFNNQFGLPFTLLKLNASHQYGVFELGANHLGEIDYLANLLKPTVSLITNVRQAHLAGFKTVQNIAQEKGQIYAHLDPEGTAIFNAEEAYLSEWEELLHHQKKITFGLSQGDVFAQEVVLGLSGSTFVLRSPLEKQKIQLSFPGQHNVMNALAAATVAYALKIPMDCVVEGLETFTGVKGRLKGLRGPQGSWLIDDSYNANPDSFKAAVDVLQQASGQKILVMGDMGELGEKAPAYHQEIGAYAKSKGVDQLLGVGTLSQFALKAFGEGAKGFSDKPTLIAHLTPLLNSKTTVLIKGSRLAGMEEVFHALTQQG